VQLSFNNLIVTGGAGGLVGYAVGYAAKKTLKLGLMIFGALAGVEVLLLTCLQNQGVLTVTVNQDRLATLSQSITLWASSQASTLTGFLTQGTVAFGSAATGFVLGFRRG